MLESMAEQQKRWLVAAVALALAVARVLLPDLNIDLVTLGLVAVAGAALLLPSVSTMLRHIRRFRVAGVELEFRDDIREVSREVDSARASVVGSPFARKETEQDVADLAIEATRDPRAALLLVSAQLERAVRDRLEAAGIEARYGLASSVEAGVQAELFDPALLSAVRDFTALRNRIAHGEAFEVPDATVLSMVSLGTDLLKIVSAVRVTPGTAGVTAKAHQPSAVTRDDTQQEG
jgi:hypothetical protein